MALNHRGLPCNGEYNIQYIYGTCHKKLYEIRGIRKASVQLSADFVKFILTSTVGTYIHTIERDNIHTITNVILLN